VLHAIMAYFIWGLLPVYWKSIANVPPFRIICHRIVWSAIFLIVIHLFKKDFLFLRQLKDKTTVILICIASLLLAVNWFTYVWSVNSGFIVEASLGYFMNPLVSVLLGIVFLKERLRKLQFIALFIALSGVIYLTVMNGRFPLISVTLAMTFAFYGLIKKNTKLSSLSGLTIESTILFIPAFVYLFTGKTQTTAFLHTGLKTDLLLVLTGPLTTIPLVLFAAGTKRISLSAIGMLQYITPTLQFVFGVVIYKETFPQYKLVGFMIIWAALLIYSIEGILNKKNHKIQFHGVR